MRKLIIKNGIVVDPVTKTEIKRDIYIENGVIKDFPREKTIKGAETLDAKGLIVLPGLIDMHVHLREPGFEYKENIKSGMEAGVAGGFTSICCMPNTNPPNDSKSVNSFLLNKAKSINLINLFTIGAVSKGLNGASLANIGELKESGAVAISDDGNPVDDSSLMARALLYAKTFDLPVISHSEDIKLRGKGVMNEGAVSQRLGVAGIPNIAEEIAVARDVLLAKYYDARLHIAHVSTKGSVNIIRRAKKEGANITCETCPHYFTLSEDSLLNYNTNAKMNPPLRAKDDVLAIKEALLDGTIDVIASDHAPHSEDEKDTTLDDAPFGIIGLQTSLPLTLKLYREKRLTLTDIAMLMSLNPANILNLGNRGGIKNGFAGDITIVDINKKWVFTKDRIKSLSKNSPFIDMDFVGLPLYIVVNANLIKAN
ncbi:MAG: dihydroorotase [Deltaproteobacteria bacterium]|jgi:dihydroorotase|nr:dihydroorotase [Deltaproteobacteria bacterium]MCL5879844.1 dihydroorotase [Deltaproteobacteria bacterium]MDA8303873.1 dihydroorotase [Deltaproteobacteria bacterium]